MIEVGLFIHTLAVRINSFLEKSDEFCSRFSEKLEKFAGVEVILANLASQRFLVSNSPYSSVELAQVLVYAQKRSRLAATPRPSYPATTPGAQTHNQ